MKISDKTKATLEHAAWAAASTGAAGAIGWLSAHAADIVGKRYEFYVSAALIPVLEYGRKWLQTRAKETPAVVAVKATVAPAPAAAPPTPPTPPAAQ